MVSFNLSNNAQRIRTYPVLHVSNNVRNMIQADPGKTNCYFLTGHNKYIKLHFVVMVIIWLMLENVTHV